MRAPTHRQGERPRAGERVSKLIARAGLCSRRDAERWIAEGRVAVDGQILRTPATVVDDPARITVDGAPLPEAERPRLFRFLKPPGVLTTARDPQGRPTIFDDLPPGLPRLMPVGRLDFNSEGLLLLTNDGALKRHLELPATRLVRRYRVRVFGTPDRERLKALAEGVTIDGVAYGKIEASVDRPFDEPRGRNVWLSVALSEGTNREVRKVLAHLGLTVNRLIRMSYGPFHLGNLPRGAGEELPDKVLREQLPAFFASPGAPPQGHAKPRRPRARGRRRR